GARSSPAVQIVHTEVPFRELTVFFSRSLPLADGAKLPGETQHNFCRKCVDSYDKAGDRVFQWNWCTGTNLSSPNNSNRSPKGVDQQRHQNPNQQQL
ncbi:AAEL005986-PA, partial [Aedes aegypti]